MKGPGSALVRSCADDVGEIIFTNGKDVEALEQEGFAFAQKRLDIVVIKQHSDLLNTISPAHDRADHLTNAI
jgi:hypothetical protein